ncbi:baculoviral IAP repeat-containing protein 2/3, partial [Mytilus galloprovincialis]
YRLTRKRSRVKVLWNALEFRSSSETYTMFLLSSTHNLNSYSVNEKTLSWTSIFHRYAYPSAAPEIIHSFCHGVVNYRIDDNLTQHIQKTSHARIKKQLIKALLDRYSIVEIKEQVSEPSATFLAFGDNFGKGFKFFNMLKNPRSFDISMSTRMNHEATRRSYDAKCTLQTRQCRAWHPLKMKSTKTFNILDIRDSTSRQQQPYAVQEAMRQPAEVQQTIRPPSVDRAHSVLEGEQNRPAHRDMAEDLGITLERPKYPAYAQLSVRVSTFQGWPGYLDQAPRDMALAGFFYAGYNDYCRCFFCGGGLRNWDAGDDPWVEHARWFSKCPFVRQNRGHRFVEIIVKRQAEMQASGASGSAKNQTAVTTQSEIEARTQVTSQETTETQTTQSETASSNRDPATESVRDMGYTDEMIKRAIDNIKQNNPGKEKIEATEILEMIFTIADDDTTTQTNTAVVSENTPSSAFGSSQASIQPSVRTTTSEAQTATSSVPASTSESSLPSLSVSSLEVANAAASGGKHQQSSASKEITENEIRSLQEENIQLKEQVMCKICMDKNVSIAFLPCGHLACCIDCAPAMRKCPMCRVYIKGTVKTYLA